MNELLSQESLTQLNLYRLAAAAALNRNLDINTNLDPTVAAGKKLGLLIRAHTYFLSSSQSGNNIQNP